MPTFSINHYPNAVFHSSDASISKLDDVIGWLSSLGIRSAATRLASYKNFFDRFYQAFGTNEFEKEHLHAYAQAQREMFELVRLKEALQSHESEHLLGRLKQVTSGQPFRSTLNHDPARDISFELSVAARFLKAGFEVDLSQVADVVVRVKGYTIYVECKRITSERKIGLRISEAYQQASRRIAASNSTKSKGLCAFEVSEIINPTLQLHVVADPRSFQQQTSQQLASYVLGKHEAIRRRSEKGVLGSLFQYVAQGLSIDEKSQEIQFTNNRGASFFPTTRTSSERQLVESFLQSLSNQGMDGFAEV